MEGSGRIMEGGEPMQLGEDRFFVGEYCFHKLLREGIVQLGSEFELLD